MYYICIKVQTFFVACCDEKVFTWEVHVDSAGKFNKRKDKDRKIHKIYLKHISTNKDFGLYISTHVDNVVVHGHHN